MLTTIATTSFPHLRRAIHREPHRRLPPDKGHLQLPVGDDAAAVRHRQVRQSGRGRGVAQNLWRWVVADRRHRRVRSRLVFVTPPFLTHIFSHDSGQYVMEPSVQPERTVRCDCCAICVRYTLCVCMCVSCGVWFFSLVFLGCCWRVYDNWPTPFADACSPLTRKYRHTAGQRVQSPEQSEHVRRRGVAQLHAAVRMITHFCYSEIAHGRRERCARELVSRVQFSCNVLTINSTIFFVCYSYHLILGSQHNCTVN